MTIDLGDEHAPLSANRTYSINCITYGSRPSAEISWWMDGKELTNHTDMVSLYLLINSHTRDTIIIRHQKIIYSYIYSTIKYIQLFPKTLDLFGKKNSIFCQNINYFLCLIVTTIHISGAKKYDTRYFVSDRIDKTVVSRARKVVATTVVGRNMR